MRASGRAPRPCQTCSKRSKCSARAAQEPGLSAPRPLQELVPLTVYASGYHQAKHQAIVRLCIRLSSDYASGYHQAIISRRRLLRGDAGQRALLLAA
eukprot:scaffold120300_cov22-Tisochrysis_lutea.AAC.1